MNKKTDSVPARIPFIEIVVGQGSGTGADDEEQGHAGELTGDFLQGDLAAAERGIDHLDVSVPQLLEDDEPVSEGVARNRRQALWGFA